ncbi:MAG: rod shape-determining protein RodA [Thermodesulfobacteria bacterium]|nr:rod shape-determining protein RodA [Thermodesulfobacteriota bacterium]
MAFELKKFAGISWSIFFVTMFLVVAGVLNQASASMGGLLFKKQLLWFALGGVLLLSFAFLDYQKILSPKVVFGGYALLVLVLAFLVVKHTRWLRLPGFSIQPSEFAKLFLICLSALILCRSEDEGLNWKVFLNLSVFTLPLVILVAATDLDQGGMLFLIYFSFLIIAGLPRRLVIAGALLAVGGALILGPYLWSLLKPYQRARVEAFLNPEAFALDRGYQIIQALIAVGSGGLKGLGFKEGLSSRLNYLPEKHTDLAFAVWAEEWGFIGASLVILAYFFLIYQILRIAAQVREPLGRYLCYGVAAMFFWEVFINIGGILHLLPVASVPLPFLSYGGSSVLVNMAAIGLVLSISRRRYSFR